MNVLPLEQKNAFEQYDVNVLEPVSVRTEIPRRLFGELHCEIHPAVVFERKDELLEHFVETKCVMIKMFPGVRFGEPDVGKIEPTIDVDPSNSLTGVFELFLQLAGNISFPARVDTGDSNQTRTIM